MSLKVPRPVFEAVLASAEKSFPEECCGILVGPVPKDFEKLGRRVSISESRPLPNGWESASRSSRYQLDPKEIFKTEKELEAKGLGIVGFYHSHPDVPAWPSPFDLERAWPCYSYWILCVRAVARSTRLLPEPGCVRAGRCEGSRSWMRSENGESFIEEEVHIA